MAYSSHSIFLDPPNWQQAQGSDHNQLPAFLPPPAPTAGNGGGIRPGSMAYRARMAMMPQPEVALKCPRCDSTNTKFCYFNNYSLTQPRHFCKSCRRYWTRGGALRNVPVGGGFRKNKKKKKSNRSKSPTATQTVMAGNSRSMGGTIISPSCNIESTTNSMSHFPSQPSQLPSIPSLQQHLSRFGSAPNNSALNFAGIHIDTELDQWKQPFIGLEPPAAAIYPQNLVNNFGANTTSSLQYNSTPFSRIPMKNEEQNKNQNEDQEQGIFLRPAYQNSHFWGSDHQNSWTDLSVLSSSSSSHLL